MVLPYRPTEQNREHRNKSLCIWPNDFWQGSQDYTMEKRQSLQQMILGKRDIHVQKNEVGSLSYTIYNSLKWIKDLKVRFLEKKHRGKPSGHCIWQWFLGYETKSTDKKSKTRQMELHWLKTSVDQRKQTTEWKGNQQNGIKYLQTI